ncbi:MAG: MoxR family ATPase [Actinomycetota bacterium]|nr:MoxR family ATPase [Actinomycetota bacterium]
MDRAAATRAARLLIENVERVIRGKRRPVEAAATALFAGGHLLIEDVPGVGKTMLGRAISRSLRGSFKRIQATPDLLPSDVTGTSVYQQAGGEFQFIPGPLFANVVLVDEINRTTPRTQSALLEAMDENAVTVDGVRHPLPDPLFVVATQNPLEHHGTYPLPEGQLDRFAIAMEMGYLDPATEREVVRAQLESHPIEDLDAVLAPEEVLGIRRAVRSTHVAPAVLDYALAIVTATRTHPDVELGASPRASIGFVRCAQARALLEGREFVIPDDLKSLAVAALAHRVIPTAGLRLERDRRGEIVRGIVADTSVPVTSPVQPPPAPAGP